MAGSTTELKVLISVLQDSAGLKQLLADIQTFLQALNSVDKVKLDNASKQVGSLLQSIAKAKSVAEEPIEIPIGVDNGKLTEATASAVSTRNALESAGASAQKVGDHLNLAGKQGAEGLEESRSKLEKLEDATHGVDRAVDKLLGTVKFLTGGFLALESVRFLRDLGDTAARTQVLGTVLHIVGINAGITNEEIDKVDKTVQRLGITASSSRQSLTQLLQADLDLKFAPKLARASQDLAVVAGTNSSATFQRLITNIQQLDTYGLRFQGIIVNRDLAEQKYAASINKSVDALTRRERQEALANAVLERAKTLEGAYAAAMGDVGKQLTSLSRYTETYRVALGQQLLPTYLVLVEQLTLLLRQLTYVAQEQNATADSSQVLADIIREWATRVRTLIVFIAEHKDLIITLIKWYVEYRAILLAIKAIDVIGGKTLAILEFFTKVTKAVEAFTAGQVGLNTALKAVRASTIEETAAVLGLKTAQEESILVQQGVITKLEYEALAAKGVTTELTALSASWSALATTLAIPIIGYIVVKRYQENAEIDKKPLFERAKLLDEQGSIYGSSSAAFNEQIRQSESLFEEWKSQNKELVDKIKATTDETERYVLSKRSALNPLGRQSPLFDEFLKQYQEFRKRDTFDELQVAKSKVEELAAAYEKLGNTGSEAEKKIAKAKLDEAIEQQSKLKQLLEGSAKGDAKVDDLKIKLFAQMEVVAQATTNFQKASHSGTQAQLEAAKKALDEGKKLEDQLEAQFAEAVSSSKNLPPDRKEAEKQLVEKKKQLLEAQRFNEEYTTAVDDLFKGRLGFSTSGEAQGAQFGKLTGAYNSLIEASKKDKEAKEAAGVPENLSDRLREGLKALADAAKTPVDFSQLQNTVKRFREVMSSPEDVKLAREVTEKARLAVRDAQLQWAAPLVAESKEAYKNRTDALIQAKQRDLEIVRQANSLEESQEKLDYDRGEVALDQYYSDRAKRIISAGQAEITLQQQQVAQLEGLRKFAQKKSEKDSLDVQVAAAKDKLALLQGDESQPGSLKAQLDENEILRQREKLSLEDQIRQMNLQTAAYYGGEIESIELITQKYDLLERKLHGVEGATDAVNRAERADILKSTLDSHNRALQERVSKTKALLDLDQQRLQYQFDQGDITQTTFIRQSNDLIQRQIALLDQQVAARRADITLLQAEREAEEARLRQQLSDPSRGLSQLQIDERVQQGVHSLTTQIDAAQNEITGYNTAILQYMDQIDTYGKRLEKTFRQSLATAIGDSLKNVKDAGNAFVKLGQAVRDQIIDTFSQHIADKITLEIAKGTTDAKGDTVFDKVFQFLGIGTGKGKKPDGTITDPLYVKSAVTTSESIQLPAGLGSTNFADLFQPQGSLPKNIFTAGPSASLSQFSSLFRQASDLFKTLFGPSGQQALQAAGATNFAGFFARGGKIDGPGTGTSDSIVAVNEDTGSLVKVSNGEYVMPEEKTKKYLPLLESIRSGAFEQIKKFRDGGAIGVQSIALPTSVVPVTHRKDGGEIRDGGVSEVTVKHERGPMLVTLHPDALNMTMRDWLENEVARQASNR